MNDSTRCLLFDLDGTLVDTDAYHLRAYNLILARIGRSIDADGYKRYVMGFSDTEILRSLFPGEPPGDYQWIINQKEEAFRGMIDELEPTHGIRELLAWATEQGLRRAVVTNAPAANAYQMLEAIGLRQEFDTIVLGGELARGKPDPLPYLTALERLGCDATGAAAFEDSLSGIRSATAAGVSTVGIMSSLDEKSLEAAGAIFSIQNFRDTRLHGWLSGKFGSE